MLSGLDRLEQFLDCDEVIVKSELYNENLHKELDAIHNNLVYNWNILLNKPCSIKPEESSARIQLGSKHLSWVTINFKPSPFEDVQRMTEFIFKSDFILEAMYVYEQRSETENFSGFHVHAVIGSNIPPNVVGKYIYKKLSTKKNPGVTHKEHIHCISLKSEYFNDKLQYMLGNKQESSDYVEKNKEQKVLMDKKFRQKYNLKKIYLKKLSIS